MPFAASLIRTPFPSGVPISNVLLTRDRITPLSSDVAFELGVKLAPPARICRPPQEIKEKRKYLGTGNIIVPIFNN